MFGIDDAIIGAVGGALLDNVFASNRQEDAQSFSAQQYATVIVTGKQIGRAHV